MKTLRIEANQLSGCVPFNLYSQLARLGNSSLGQVPFCGLPVKPSPRYRWQGSTIVVSWDPSAEATYYKVYYDDFRDRCEVDSDGDTRWCDELDGNVVGTTYTHSDPDDHRNYYWVAACNSKGCSSVARASYDE